MIQISTSPKIEFYSHKGSNKYYEFSQTSEDISGRNLQAYNFHRQVNVFSSSFSVTVKESTKDGNTDFIDQVNPLDVVKIYENDTLCYVGLVTNISYSSQSSGFSKLCTVSGKGIEYLLEYLTVALDATAMSFLGENESTLSVEALNAALTTSLSKGDEPCTVEHFLEKVYKSFTQFENMTGITNIELFSLIEKFLGKDADFFSLEDGLEFLLPISSSLFSQSTVNMISYIRNLLPDIVYEMFAVIEGNKTVIKVRRTPFNQERWGALNEPYRIYGDVLTDYSLNKSIDEVYTVFYSYVEGSELSPDFYAKINSNIKGNSMAKKNLSKLGIYGYKPLITSFIGFNRESEGSSYIKKMEGLNEDLLVMFGHQDELFSATIGIIKTDSNIPTIGQRLKFLDGEFYVVGESHQWSYGQSIKVTYNCIRGGKYDADGNYTGPITNIGRKLSEWEVLTNEDNS